MLPVADRIDGRAPCPEYGAQPARAQRGARMTEVAAPPATHRLFIAGRWVDSVVGRDVRERQPRRHAGRRRAVPGGHGRRTSRWPSAPRRWRSRPGARRRRPKRGEILYRFGALMAEHKERLARAMTREMGKVISRGARRRPGGHRHRVPDGRRGPSDVRRHGAVGAARQVGDEHPPAASASPGSSRRGTSRWRSRAGRRCRRWSPATPSCSSPRRTRRTARRSSSSSWRRPASRRAS